MSERGVNQGDDWRHNRKLLLFVRSSYSCQRSGYQQLFAQRHINRTSLLAEKPMIRGFKKGHAVLLLQQKYVLPSFNPWKRAQKRSHAALQTFPPIEMRLSVVLSCSRIITRPVTVDRGSSCRVDPCEFAADSAEATRAELSSGLQNEARRGGVAAADTR